MSSISSFGGLSSVSISRTPGSYFSTMSSNIPWKEGMGGERSSAIYGFNDKARCITAQTGEKQLNRFFVGTANLKPEYVNQIHHIEVAEDKIDRVAVYDHPRNHEIWHISCCPIEDNKNLLFTVYNTVPTFQASLWRIVEESGELEEINQLGDHTGSIKCILWKSQIENDNSVHVVSLDDYNIRLWDVATAKEITCLHTGELSKLATGCWDHHVRDHIVTANGPDLVGYDLRQKSKTFSVGRAHGQNVRDVDVNPRNQYFFVSSGDDCKIKFWDQRMLDHPQKVEAKHSHWVWKVKYNPKFDAFLISSSTDGTVNLWNATSLAYKNTNIERETVKRPDKQIRSYDDHEDSVYSICWSSSDSDVNIFDWATFASLSYDGRVVVNRVPNDDVRQALRDL